MSKIKILSLIGIAGTLFVGYQYFLILSSEIALFERFPDIPQSDVIAASRKMYRDALRGKFANVDTDDEELMDQFFLSYVNNL